MKKYAFDPPVVQLEQGETVILEVSSADVPHGVEVPDLKIREPVHRDQPPAVVTLTAARKGEFLMQRDYLRSRTRRHARQNRCTVEARTL